MNVGSKQPKLSDTFSLPGLSYTCCVHYFTAFVKQHNKNFQDIQEEKGCGKQEG